MKQINVSSKNTNSFYASREEAFRLLFTMIMGDKNTRFWFGTTSSGDISLYINTADLIYITTIETYKFSDKPEDIFNKKMRLSLLKQTELLSEFYQNPMNVHQAFMKEYGDQAKEFWAKQEIRK